MKLINNVGLPLSAGEKPLIIPKAKSFQQNILNVNLNQISTQNNRDYIIIEIKRIIL